MEAALDRRECAASAERLHCVHPAARYARGQRQAGEARLVVHQHRAGAAFAAVAAGLGAGEADGLAQVVEEKAVAGDRVDAPAPVEGEFENSGHSGLPACWAGLACGALHPRPGPGNTPQLYAD